MNDFTNGTKRLFRLLAMNDALPKGLAIASIIGEGGNAPGVETTVTGVSPLLLAAALNKPIKSLTQYGLCSQASTPTPSAPVDIMCNNGAVRMVHRSGLPSGYKLLEYVGGSGSQYIPTPVKIASTDIIEAEFRNSSASGYGALYGIYAMGQSSAFYANRTYYGYDVSNGAVNTNIDVDTEWHSVKHDFVNGVLTLDGDDFSFIEKIGLKENLSPTRANGLVSMINTIKAAAAENMPKEEAKEEARGGEVLSADDVKDLAPLYENVILALKQVYDPEIPVNIYDLGLIYELNINKAREVYIKMTFTAPNCPMADEVLNDVKVSVEDVPGVKGVNIDLVFEPVWDRSMLSEEARLELGLDDDDVTASDNEENGIH